MAKFVSLLFPSPACFLAILLVLVFLSSCSPISGRIMKEAQGSPSFTEIKKNPNRYKNKMVILGGTIAQVKNLKNKSYIEIIQNPLDNTDYPLDSSKSSGRFLVLTSRFIDPQLYSVGKRITVAGRIIGGQPGVIGQRTYVYPLIAASQIHLWPSYSASEYDYQALGMGMGPFMGPSWGWGGYGPGFFW
ncbi:Slp family lipoprotein [Candidatus Methylacidiphilum infernorum]|nr:Slp family lipoprotein [Candidatus Methylacidiphilum infernorum]